MSAPVYRKNPSLTSVVRELLRVESSLNMGREELPNAADSDTDWISETLVWGRHAVLHLHNAIDMLLEIDERERKLLMEKMERMCE